MLQCLQRSCSGICASELMQGCARGTAAAGRCSPPADPKGRGAPAAAHWLVQTPCPYDAASSAATRASDIMHALHDGCCTVSAIGIGSTPRLPTHRPPSPPESVLPPRNHCGHNTPIAERMVLSITAYANETRDMTKCASYSLRAPSSRHGGQRDGTVLIVWYSHRLQYRGDHFCTCCSNSVSLCTSAATVIDCCCHLSRLHKSCPLSHAAKQRCSSHSKVSRCVEYQRDTAWRCLDAHHGARLW
jgi:hypothetical protein